MNKNNSNKPEKTIAYARNRFSNTLLATQFLILASALNAYFLSSEFIGQHQVPYLFGIRFDVALLSACAILVIPLLHIVSRYSLEKATFWYFWLLSVLTAVMAVVEGGLYSVPVMCFPIIAIFAALHTQQSVFLSICGFFSVVVVLMAINHNYGWFEGMVTSGSARMIDFLILVLISSYIAWSLGRDMKQSIAQLKFEHQQVVESRKLIQHLADTDSLTNLANRSYAITRFEAMQAELDLTHEEIGLYFVDLDNFKSINDMFDHYMGDKLLKIIAKRLSRIVDTNGLVCRLGGDEFALFIKVGRPFDHDALAREILVSLSEPHLILGTQSEITASIGITVINDKDISFDNARKQADMAMYKSKQSGKNDYHQYSEVLHRDYMRNLMMIDGLKDALNKGLFDLHFQPKVAIDSNQVIGAEALLRWSRENTHNLAPSDFIPIIESTELIHSIGTWVIDQACAACKQWHEKGYAISVAVNVSASQLARPGFYGIINNALHTSGLQAQFLEIELTEHFLIQENATIKSQLSELKRLGVKLAIDDFGTGYSNMGYLTRFEVDTLKLDRSFICEIEQSPNTLAIVTAINEMASVMGMSVVAEGVEKESERQVLAKMGCDIGQGFLWSKALPCHLLIEYLKPIQPVSVTAR